MDIPSVNDGRTLSSMPINFSPSRNKQSANDQGLRLSSRDSVKSGEGRGLSAERVAAEENFQLTRKRRRSVSRTASGPSTDSDGNACAV